MCILFCFYKLILFLQTSSRKINIHFTSEFDNLSGGLQASTAMAIYRVL